MLEFRSAWRQGGLGVIGTLFLYRVLLESLGRGISTFVIIAGGLVAGGSGFMLGNWLIQRGVRLWPAMFLLPYVLWPWRAPWIAAAVAALALLTALLAFAPRRWSVDRFGPWADVALFLVALLAYGSTVFPDVLPADSGEFQLVAARLGVAHPPGFPLYTLMGHLFIRLIPWGSPAYRLNLLSALLAAGTLVFLARATRAWARRLGAAPPIALGAGIASALALGTATTFWAQATIANIRTPTAFFTALTLYALARLATAGERAEADRALLLLGLGLGIGLGHHPSLAFAGVFFLAYVLLVEPRIVIQPRRWWRPALGALLGLLPYAYLPIRGAMDAPLAPPNLNTWTGFLHHALARGFAGDMFAYANAADLPHRLALLPTLFPFQFNRVLLALAGLGLAGLLWRDWRLFLMLCGSVVIHTFVTITYRAPQTVEYLMPAYLPLAVAVGLCPVVLKRVLQWAGWPALMCALAVWAGLLNGWAHAPSFVTLAQDRAPRERVEPLLTQAPTGALILADWRWATPLWYLQQIEGLRPDVEVQYVYNVAGEEYWDTWERRIRAASPERPILLTHLSRLEGYTTEPWGAGFTIRPGPVDEPRAPLTPVDVRFGDTVAVVGASLRPEQAQPGEAVELVLAWRALAAPERVPSFTVRLVNRAGQAVAQADQRLSADVAPGEVRFAQLTLPLNPGVAPGRYTLQVGAYVVTEAGFEMLPVAGADTAPLTDLVIAPAAERPFTLHRRALPFRDGPTLIGVDYDRSVPGVLRVYTRWQGPIPPGWRVKLGLGAGVEAVAALPAIPAGAYQTAVVDLPSGEAARPQMAVLDSQGAIVPGAGGWGWPVRRARLPRAGAEARFVPVGGDVAVVGVDFRAAAPGGTALADVCWVALTPLTEDYAVSVRLMDAEGRWLARHDMQPALGAVPTLKWIRGSRVVDRHPLPVPEDFGGDTVQAALVIYERFREATRPTLDGRFTEVPLGTWPRP